MKILVCVKQVPDSAGPFILKKGTRWIDESQVSFRMNSYDEHALEEALIIKETHKDVTIDVLSVGPERARGVVKKSLEKGADRAFFIHSPERLLTAYETALLIASHIKRNNYHLVLAGVMSEDLMQQATGPIVAALAGIPCAAAVISLSLNPGKERVTAGSEREGGKTETFSLTLPALLTIQSGINEPRYPCLTNVLRARRMEPDVLSFTAGAKKKEEYTALAPPVRNITGSVLEGTSEEKAEALSEIFRKEGLL